MCLRHVYRETQNDGLRIEHTQRTAQILLQKLAEVNLNLLLLSVDSPILRTTTQLGGFVDKNHRRIGFFEKEQAQSQTGKAHNGNNIFRPTPAKVGYIDETSDERGEQGAGEDGDGEDGNGDTSGAIVEHVGEDSSNASKRAGSEESREEAADQDCLQIFACGDCYGEDGEAEGRN